MKFGLGMFWIAVICVACLISFKYLYGVDVFEVKSRNYYLNLAETINLDNIYSSDDVVWESDSDNVVIKNNVVFANKTGSAYILGRIGEQQVSDVKVNVLSADAALSLENHSVSLSVGESTQIKVNQIASTTNNGDNIQSSLSNSSITNGSNIKDEIDDDIVTDEYEEEDGSDTLINDDSMDDFDDYYDGDYVNDENDSSDSEKLGDIIIDDKLNAEAKSVFVGGTGSNSSLLTQPDFLPDKFECGTLNIPGIVGLLHGINYINKEGISTIKEKEDFLCQKAINGLLNIKDIKIYGSLDMKKKTSVISFNINDMDPSLVGYMLDSEFNISSRTGLHCAPLAHKTVGSYPNGSIRISLGYFNTEKEIDIFLNAINTIKNRR